MVALVVGVVISAATVLAQWRIDVAADARAERLAAQAEEAAMRRDDLRFVREVAAGPPGAARPFSRLDLEEANLSGLPLGCASPSGRDCATFNEARLSGAVLTGADLRGASFVDANLTGVLLIGAELRDVTFDGANVSNVRFANTDLRGASFVGAYVDGESAPDFSGADLRGVTFAPSMNFYFEDYMDLTDAMSSRDLVGDGVREACWDETTVWPEEFTTIPSNPQACRPN